MANNPFQEQFLKAGLVDADRVKKASAQKRKQKKQRKEDPDAAERKRAAQQAAAKKAEQDRKLNQRRKEEAEQRAVTAQIKQIIETHRQPKGEGEIAYNYTENGKVRRLYVTEAQQQQLTRGALAVVKLHGKYDLVPADAAQKIKERDERCVIVLNDPKQANAPADDDPYAEYKVPDDLMW